MKRYAFDEDTNFVICGYRQAPPFASFLPGLAGIQGIPTWAFYVNRAQGVCGFGVQDKDHAIMPFYPAHQAYQEVAYKGFRTFIKTGGRVFEPFAGAGEERMTVRQNSLSLCCTEKGAGLQTDVTYFTMTDEPFAALCRRVVITNVGGAPLTLEVLDGLAELIPHGIGDLDYKSIGNTLMAWMDVFNLENGAPFFRVRASTADNETVERVTGGNFYLSTVNGRTVSPVVDASLVFGRNTTLAYPDAFARNSVETLSAAMQITVNKVPCAFTPLHATLLPGESVKIRTLIGYMGSVGQLNRQKEALSSPAFFDRKEKDAEKLVGALLAPASCRTGSKVFDAYIAQCFLDNMLRGGRPVTLGDDARRHVYYICSRKHGDLERDYNAFHLDATPYSQGNGNFRDVCQNRRCDNYFFPETGDCNIRLFAELIQADGYNPLHVNGSVFSVSSDTLRLVLEENGVYGANAQAIAALLRGPYLPGKLMEYLQNPVESLHLPAETLFHRILSHSVQDTSADFGEGYWSDHWTYCLDLIEKYLSIYPDRQDALLLRDDSYRFYQSPAYVRPRSLKYRLAGQKMAQIHAVELGDGRGGWMHNTDGSLCTVTLYAKLFLLALLKFATLDPAGIGVEMEAGKPGWNDSLNGLPGLLGSGVSETVELKRLMRFLHQSCKEPVVLPHESVELLGKLRQALDGFCPGENADFRFWDSISTARETYRAKTRHSFSGARDELPAVDVRDFLSRAAAKLDDGLARALAAGNGLLPAYLCFEPTDYRTEPGADGAVFVRPLGFKMRMLPHYLEASARYMKLLSGSQAEKLEYAVRASDLYDEPLGMFKLSGPLETMPHTVGRARSFTPGYLENESVFLHMEYKYLLALLKAGLSEAFFRSIRTALIPFLDPEIYGRSTLEHCSFLVSSVNPDPGLRGRGLVARLSGSTVEMLDMWMCMTAGPCPFTLENGVLTLRFQPTLPRWLFDADGSLSFTFLGKTRVTYHHMPGTDLCGGESAAKTVVCLNDAKQREEQGNTLTGVLAAAVRAGDVQSVDVYFD